MNLATLDMPSYEARAAFLDYRKAVQANRNAEDELLMNAYRQVASGKRVVDIFETIKAGGLDDAGRPKLAIGRADWTFAFLRRDESRPMRFSPTQLLTRGKQGSVFIPHQTFGDPPRKHYRNDKGETWSSVPSITGRALTPTIPPWARPKFKIENYHILWEAVWEPVPPVDPALLKHIGGPLYVVMATWDLTPLERSVLSQRLLSAN